MSKLIVHNCNRCSYEWASKSEIPKTCASPKCRTPYWNKPRIKKLKSKQLANSFHFYFDNNGIKKSYSFTIMDFEIVCIVCNERACEHVNEIILNATIREQISRQGIEISQNYETQIKERGKNIGALREFVQKQTR